MSTYTNTPEPVTLVRGASGSLPLRWQDPNGVPIDVTGFSLTAALDTRDRRIPLVAGFQNATWGMMVVSWAAADVAALPIGRVSRLFITLTDTAQNAHVFEIPVNGVLS